MPVKGSGFVLAGGQSRRMGREKALLRYGDRTLLQCAIDTLQEAGLFVSVVATPGQQLGEVRVPILEDLVPEAGPLGGVYTALARSRTQENYFIPCDVPRLEARLYEITAARSSEADVIIWRDRESGLHPLCGYYSRRCQPVLLELLEAGRFRMDGVSQAGGLRSLVLSAGEHSIPEACFLNVNSLEEYRRLLELDSSSSPD